MDDGIFIDHGSACVVNDADTVLHDSDRFVIDHAAGFFIQRNVEREIVTLLQKFIEACDALYVAADFPCRIDGEVGVIGQYLHVELESDVGNQGTDVARSDDAQYLACIFGSGELFFDLFHPLFDGAVAAVIGVDPLHAVEYVAARHPQGKDKQFFNAVGISARRVEDDDALFGALVERNGVDADAGAADALELGIERVVMQVAGPHEEGIGVRLAVTDFVVRFLQDFAARW